MIKTCNGFTFLFLLVVVVLICVNVFVLLFFFQLGGRASLNVGDGGSKVVGGAEERAGCTAVIHCKPLHESSHCNPLELLQKP